MFSLKMSHSSSGPWHPSATFSNSRWKRGRLLFLVVTTIGREGDCWFGGCKNCKDALSPSTFDWTQTRKCVMNYEQEGIHWRIKIQLSSFADISWGTASKYLIVRQWHCDGCLRDKYSAVGPPGTAGGKRDYKSTASESFAQKACEVILTAAPNPKSEKFFPPLAKKKKILHRWEA